MYALSTPLHAPSGARSLTGLGCRVVHPLIDPIPPAVPLQVVVALAVAVLYEVVPSRVVRVRRIYALRRVVMVKVAPSATASLTH